MRVLTVLGGALALAITALSVAANFWYGYAIFAHGWESWIYGPVFACLDGAKALMPLLAAWAWTARQRGAACVAVIIFVPMVLFSGFTEITVYMVTKGKTVGEAKADRGAFERAAADLAGIEDQLRQAGQARPAAAIIADMEGRKVDARWKRSQECANVTLPDSRDFCAAFRHLEGELASARNVDQLRADRAKARAKLDGMDGAKALSSTDAQADLLKRVFSEPDLMLGLFLAFLIEAGSGFLPWIVEQAARPRREEAPQAAEAPAAAIAPELIAPVAAKPRKAPVRKRAERTVPADVQAEVNAWLARNAIRDAKCSIGATDLFEAYQLTGGTLKQARFGAAVRALGGERKGSGNRLVYRGLALRGSAPMLAVVGGNEATIG